MISPAKGWTIAAAGLVLALAVVSWSVAAPLAVYSLTLAAFGLPHVLSELRYVDRRFGRALGAATVWRMGALLALIMGTRAAGLAHRLPARTEVMLELGLVAILALTAARGPSLRQIVAVAVGLAIGVLAIVSPFETTLTFSVLHNLTPLGFLWQLAPRSRRAQVMAWATAAFVGLPLVVATGLPRTLLDHAGGLASSLDPLGVGSLRDQLFVYVPRALVQGGHAIDLFTASVVAQQAHYLAVIVVLPWLLGRWGPGARGLVPWPRGLLFAAPVAILGAVMLSRFAADFSNARGLYGLAAAVHAWIEIPILITALLSPQPPISSPAPSDAPLAASETSIA